MGQLKQMREQGTMNETDEGLGTSEFPVSCSGESYLMNNGLNLPTLGGEKMPEKLAMSRRRSGLPGG